MEHNMKGFLSFLIMWLLRNRDMTGNEIAKELEKRRGTKPSSGTIYPALKELVEKGLITADENKVYSLTKDGKKKLSKSCHVLCMTFYDMKEMLKYHRVLGKKRL